MRNLQFAVFIVLFEKELFTIAGTVRYSSTAFILPENMRLIHMPLIEKVKTHYASKPRIIVPKHPSRYLAEMTFTPIKGNQILLFAKYFEKITFKSYLHLSIHGICSDHRVGPALWSFNGSVDSHFDIDDLVLIKSTENALGITFAVQLISHWKLFDISTTEPDALDKFPLIEFGKIDYDQKLMLNSVHRNSFGLSKVFMQSC
jgi:hypothetical protein